MVYVPYLNRELKQKKKGAFNKTYSTNRHFQLQLLESMEILISRERDENLDSYGDPFEGEFIGWSSVLHLSLKTG